MQSNRWFIQYRMIQKAFLQLTITIYYSIYWQYTASILRVQKSEGWSRKTIYSVNSCEQFRQQNLCASWILVSSSRLYNTWDNVSRNKNGIKKQHGKPDRIFQRQTIWLCLCMKPLGTCRHTRSNVLITGKMRYMEEIWSWKHKEIPPFSSEYFIFHVSY
jgi:hypothetical protein